MHKGNEKPSLLHYLHRLDAYGEAHPRLVRSGKLLANILVVVLILYVVIYARPF